MTPGLRYRIRYRLPGSRQMLEAVMDFLGTNHVGQRLEYVFSARPIAGTQTLFDVVEVEEVAMTTNVYINRRVKVGA